MTTPYHDSHHLAKFRFKICKTLDSGQLVFLSWHKKIWWFEAEKEGLGTHVWAWARSAWAEQGRGRVTDIFVVKSERSFEHWTCSLQCEEWFYWLLPFVVCHFLHVTQEKRPNLLDQDKPTFFDDSTIVYNYIYFIFNLNIRLFEYACT